MKPTGKNAIEGEVKKPAVTKQVEGTDEVIDFTNVTVEDFMDDIDYNTFLESDLRVVKVLNCEDVKKSDKLLKFTIDDGTGTDRTILSGVKKFYEPEELIGKNLVAILNLPPKPMMGEESNGMLLSAVHFDGEDRISNLIMVSNRIPAGAKLH